jgi:type 2 lantibiotic biosynthesis protein LanM
MNQQCFETYAWYHGIPLAERIASLHTVPAKTLNVEVNAELAQRRMQRWRSQSPFMADSDFAQRLAIDGITEDEFLYLLGEPIKAVQERFPDPPTWLVNLGEAFSHPATSNPEPLPSPEELQGQEVNLFLYVIEPLIRQGCERVHEGVQALSQTRSDLPFEPNTVAEMLLANLRGKLLMILERTMVLELQVARLQGVLKGNTPQERFYSFLQHLHQSDKILALLQEYPVLAHQLTIQISQWVTFSLEFLHHLCADWDAIRTTFSPKNDLGLLVAVQGGGGDSHRGGRSVLIAKFSSGFQVVYKPRSLATDVHFQQLLTWLNERGDHPPFRTLKILERGTYGWVEFVALQSCSSPEEVQRFYQRQGGYLALLYALYATDFHYENLIAAGEHPVLIDLEALFHPRKEYIDTKELDRLASSTLAQSVLHTGLLPQRRWSDAEYEGIDVSGLGGKEGQLSPAPIPYWEGAGSDEMRLKRKRIEMPGKSNQPTLNGTKVNILEYIPELTAGFTKIYQLLLQYRDELLSANGPLACFAEDEVRVILRNTRSYTLLLTESFHPNLLRNALDRDRFFDRLWVEVKHRPYLAKVIFAEREDLHKGDIPMFTTRSNSRDLWSSSNHRLTDFFDQTGIALVHRRLRQLSVQDLGQQLQFIRASLATLTIGANEAKMKLTYRLTAPQSIADRKRMLTAAQAIGDRLEALALRGEDDVTWIGLTANSKGYWSFGWLGMDLYQGLAGIVLFLAYLGAITQKSRYTSLAQDALTTLRRQVEPSKSSIKSIGGFLGWGGIIYTLTHLGVLWNQPVLLAEAEELVELIPALLEKDEQLDIIGGAAGCLGSLISLYRCRPSQRTLAVAIQCGDWLLAQAQPMDQGVGWVTPIPATKPLTGFSHGAAGMAWALLGLTTITGEERFRTTGLAAITYERSLFAPKVGNWRDNRNPLANKGQEPFMTVWCHGAPGIGLARLCCLPHLDDAEIRSEINTALKTTLTHGFGFNHSLCHGDLGNLELLLQASQTLDDPQWKTQVDRLAAIILESIDKHGWLCGVPLGVETPSLMTGLAGIGYGLLRLAEPTRVPSILVLAPPTLCGVAL